MRSTRYLPIYCNKEKWPIKCCTIETQKNCSQCRNMRLPAYLTTMTDRQHWPHLPQGQIIENYKVKVLLRTRIDATIVSPDVRFFPFFLAIFANLYLLNYIASRFFKLLSLILILQTRKKINYLYNNLIWIPDKKQTTVINFFYFLGSVRSTAASICT